MHGPGIDEPLAEIRTSPDTGTYYLHADHAGTVIARSNASGVIPAGDTFAYSSSGEPNKTEGPIWRYTGRQLDAETGLYYYRARTYNPTTGRFMQTDPAGDTDSLNLYQYAMWDPIMNKDPTGKFVPALVTGCAANPACATAVLAGLAVTGKVAGDALKTWVENQGQPDSTQPNQPSDGNTNPYDGPVDEPVIVVDKDGNAIPVDKGQSIGASPDGRFQEVKGPNGERTGTRKDDGHPKQRDPSAQVPHAYRPGVTTPDGNPHLPIRGSVPETAPEPPPPPKPCTPPDDSSCP